MELRSGFFFFCLSFLLRTSFTIIRTSSSADKVEIDIENGLPSNETLRLSCGEGASLSMKIGDHHKVSVPADSNNVVTCNAMWKQFFTNWWILYNQTRDNHPNMFWSVRQDGFYRSWDGRSYWQLLDVWFTD